MYIVNKCDLEVNFVNCNGESVVISILNLIHFFSTHNFQTWIQKQTSYVIFVYICLNCPQNEILRICYFIYHNGMDQEILSHFIKKFLPKISFWLLSRDPVNKLIRSSHWMVDRMKPVQ
jgi:hypothetical protein